MADDAQVGIEYESDKRSADAAADELYRALSRAGDAFAAEFGRRVRGDLGASLRNAFTSSNADAFQRTTSRVADDIRRGSAAAKDFENDFRALKGRAEAFLNSFRGSGVDSRVTAVIERSLDRIVTLQRRAEADQERIATDPGVARAYEIRYNQIRTALSQDVALIQSRLKELTETTVAESKRQTEVTVNESRERVAKINAERARTVTETQRAGALELQALRASNAQKLQSDRITSRRRIELLRVAAQQVKVFERAVAATVRGTGRALGGIAGGFTRGLSRIRSALRRSDRDVSDGLGPALERREGLLRRSFQEQETIIRRSARRQEAVLTRLEAQSSRGVTGALTGRSRLGGLVGGGLAIGGGFALISKLKEGFEESVNLNEQLNATRAIFRDAADAVVEFSEDSVGALFVTQSAALETAAAFGAFGKAAGLQGKDLSDFSNRLSLLATDLASFKNTSVQEAVTAISAALRGETEPIRNYQVLLDQATLQQTAFADGIVDSIRKLTPQERVLAAYSEILKQTKDAQGDAAKTANDFANSSKRAGAALVTTAAALVRRLIPIGEIITNSAFPALQNLTRFIEGDVSPALRTLRTALIGVGAALGLLLAAKVAAEAIGFLGIALRATLTPMGFFITSVAAIGGIVAVAAARSEDFAAALDQVVPTLRNLAGRGIDIARRGLSLLAAVLDETVLPALRTFLRLIIRPAFAGLEYVVGFVQTVAIPVFRNFAGIIERRLGPAFALLGGFLQGTVVPALRRFAEVALGALRTAVEFLQPAIDGFRDLGGAIALAFSQGDFSEILGGLRSLASGVGTVFANLGILIYENLRPQLEAVASLLSRLFDRIDFTSIAVKLLEVVRLIGYALGRIVSDPAFAAAVAGIVAAALIIGAKLIQGIAQGVRDGAKEWGPLIGPAITKGLSDAFTYAVSNPARIVAAVGLGLPAAILAALAGRQVLRAFQRAGAAGAGGFASGLGRGIASSPGRFVNTINGLFGGTGGINDAIAFNGRKAAERYQKEVSRTLRNFRRIGVTPSTNLLDTKPDQAALRRLQGEFANVEKSIGRTQTAARLFSQRSSESFRGIAGGIGQLARVAIPGLSGSLTRARSEFGQAFTAIGDGFARLRAQGITTGQALGNAVLAGFGAAISGQQLGSGNKLIGISGILASAIAAGVATGSAPIGLAVGGLGLLTAAITRNKQAAKEAAAQVDQYADAIVRAGGVAEARSDIGKALVDTIGDFDIDLQERLASFNLDAFIEAINRGRDPVVAAFAGVASAIGIPNEAIGRLAENVDAFARAGERGKNALVGAVPTSVIRDLEDALDGTGVSINEFLSILGKFSGEGSALVEGSREAVVALQILGTVTDEAAGPPARLAAAIENTRDRIRTAFFGVASDSTNAFSSLSTALDSVFSELGAGVDFAPVDLSGLEASTLRIVDYLRLPTLEALKMKESLQDVGKELASFDVSGALAAFPILGDDLAGLNDELDDTAPKVDLVQEAIRGLNDQRTERIRSEVSRLRGRLEEAREAADTARDAITSFFTSNRQAPRLVDDLIGNVGSIGSSIEDALRQGGVRGDAALRSAVGGFEDQLASIIQAGFDDGLRSQSEFAALLAPLQAALNEEIGDAGRRILSNVDFTEGITPQAGAELADALSRALSGNKIEAGVSAAFAAQTEVDRIQRQLENYEANLDVKVRFDEAQIEQALRDAGASQAVIAGLDFSAVEDQALSELEKAARDASAATPATPATGAPVQQGDINIIVDGSGDPVATGSAVVRAAGAAASGRVLPAGARRYII